MPVGACPEPFDLASWLTASSSAASAATHAGPPMHGPHILVLPPPELAVEVPTHQTVDVDKGVAIDNDATHWFADGYELASLGIAGLEFDACDPSVRGVALDPSLALRQAHRAPVTSQEAISHRVALGLGVRHRQKPLCRTGDARHVRRLPWAVLWATPPGTISHCQTINSDSFAVQHQLSSYTSDLIEMLRTPER